MSVDPREEEARRRTRENQLANERHRQRLRDRNSPSAQIQRRVEQTDRRNEATRRETNRLIEEQTRSSIEADRFSENPEMEIAEAIARSQTGRGGLRIAPIPQAGTRQRDLDAARERQLAESEARAREQARTQAILRGRNDPSFVNTQDPRPEDSLARGATTFRGKNIYGVFLNRRYVVVTTDRPGGNVLYEVYRVRDQRKIGDQRLRATDDPVEGILNIIRPNLGRQADIDSLEQLGVVADELLESEPVAQPVAETEAVEDDTYVIPGSRPHYPGEGEETPITRALSDATAPLAEAVAPLTNLLTNQQPTVEPDVPTTVPIEDTGDTDEEEVETPQSIGGGGTGETTPDTSDAATEPAPFRETVNLNCLQESLNVGTSIFGSRVDTTCRFDLDARNRTYSRIELEFDGRQPYAGGADVIISVNGRTVGNVNWSIGETGTRKQQRFNITDQVYDGENEVEVSYGTGGITLEDSTLTFRLQLRLEGTERESTGTTSTRQRMTRAMSNGQLSSILPAIVISASAIVIVSTIASLLRRRR